MGNNLSFSVASTAYAPVAGLARMENILMRYGDMTLVTAIITGLIAV